MSEDIRVILIKIADRLHNMRTLGSQRKNKQYKIAGETLYIYAPLAHRLGLNKIKSELENLSFRFEHPTEYENIVFKLANTEAARKTVFDAFTAPIRARLDSMGIKYEIKQRIKTPYSIWMKMQNKHVPFEEIYDILAVRIIFDPSDLALEKSECFNIYVALTNIYDSHPDRIRDWVTHPKANGYQALHVTLMFRDEVHKAKGEWIEVQIRSRRMDEIAEKGFAAHWKYKDGDIDLSEVENEKELDKWLTTIKEILDDPQPNDMDFLNTIKLNLYASEIFVFTPKGEIRTLPAGSTALDFAFTIHTFVGSHCIGAKVNHKLVPMSHKLQSGDQVEVLTSKSQHVDRSWLNIATTAKATTTTAKVTTTTAKATTTTAKVTTTTAQATTTTEAITTTSETTTQSTTTAITSDGGTDTTPAQTTTTAPPEPEPLKGDVDGNDEVSVEDAQLALKSYTKRIAGVDMGLTEEQIKAADVNEDGELSVDDAQNILIYYVNNTVAGNVLTWEQLLGKQQQAQLRPKSLTLHEDIWIDADRCLTEAETS
jgi:RelA/SpoT family (p)ppGpp synthetase